MKCKTGETAPLVKWLWGHWSRCVKAMLLIAMTFRRGMGESDTNWWLPGPMNHRISKNKLEGSWRQHPKHNTCAYTYIQAHTHTHRPTHSNNTCAHTYIQAHTHTQRPTHTQTKMKQGSAEMAQLLGVVWHLEQASLPSVTSALRGLNHLHPPQPWSLHTQPHTDTHI